MTQLHAPRSWRLRRWSRASRTDSIQTRQPAPRVPERWTPRILILSASVGAGHIRAAQAIESSLARILPDAFISHVDVLTLTNAVFRRAYGAGYFYVAQHAPRFVGQMYDLLDHPAGSRAPDIARLAFQRLNFMRLTRLLTDNRWDLVINTHFLPPELISSLRRRGKVTFPQATVVTDFDVHGMWINQPCEKYFVATDEARANVMAAGVAHGQIEVTGIPIDTAFSFPVDVTACLKRHGLALDRPVVLQLAGGFGVGSIEQIYRSIQDVPKPLQVVIVAGKNQVARERLESLPAHPRHRCKILGFTTDMHELMAAATVVVSKPGGLTTSECLARNAPMVIVEPIPGQEDRNSDFLLENGCGIKVNNLASLTHKLTSLLANPDRLALMRQQIASCARPRAAFDVAAGCAEMLCAPTGSTHPALPSLSQPT